MAKFIIKGGNHLYGSVRVGGAKNASYKILLASLLAHTPSRLLNIPQIAEVEFCADLIRSLGGKVERKGERMLSVDPQGLSQTHLSPEAGNFSRVAPMFLPILLARFHEAWVPLPGGDKIGKRPLERHFAGLQALGAKLEVSTTGIQAVLPQKKFTGATYRFEKNSHTGTETVLLASVLAEGITILENAAVEPEVIDLVNFLTAMGAHIKLIRPRTWEIYGTPHLYGTIYKIMPDRNEVVSYACAALATKGDIVVENAREADLLSFLPAVENAGGGYQVGEFGIRFFYYQPLQATQITTSKHPGFMTDWQPLWAVVMATAHGVSEIHETVTQSRFQYSQALSQMGTKLELFAPQVAHPDIVYNFNLSDDEPNACHGLRIYGPSQFCGGEFYVSDLRSGATLILAGLQSKDTTILNNIIQIDRGYEKLDQRLRQLGADIKRL